LEWFNAFNALLSNIPNITYYLTLDPPTYFDMAVAGEYFEYIDKAFASDANFQKYMGAHIPDGASSSECLQYRIIYNCIKSIQSARIWDLSKASHANNVILHVLDGLYKNMGHVMFKIPGRPPGAVLAHRLSELQGFKNSDGKVLVAINTDLANFTTTYTRLVASANSKVNLIDLQTETTHLDTEIKRYEGVNATTFINNANRKYQNFITTNYAVLKGEFAKLRAPKVYTEESITILSTPVQFITIGRLPAFNDALINEFQIILEQVRLDSDILTNEYTTLLTNIAAEITKAKNELTALNAKIALMSRKILTAVAKLFDVIDESPKINADIEEEAHKKEATAKYEKEQQKLADDEYNARIEALAQIPDETLADRVARIPVEYSNVIHYAMAKRIVKLTGDTSYDISAAEMGNTSLVRDKLVKFFTAQGVKDVTRDNINRKYAEWQKKNTARLVHQSDIDNPSGVILELA
jgi:hypothetical protein